MKTKFKVGDWVRFKNTPHMISKIEDFHYDGIVNTKNGYHIEERFLELWFPKEDEYVWSEMYGLCYVNGYDKTDNTYALIPQWGTNKEIRYMELLDLQPFIGELPSFMKDKQ